MSINKHYSICLSNNEAIFDSADNLTLDEAIAWAKGRGGNYLVQIGVAGDSENPGAIFSYSDDSQTFKRYNGDEWESIPEKRLHEYI